MAEIVKKYSDGKYLVLDTKKDMLLIKHKTDTGSFGYYKHYEGDTDYYYTYNSRTRSFSFFTKDEMETIYHMVAAYMVKERNSLKNGIQSKENRY